MFHWYSLVAIFLTLSPYFVAAQTSHLPPANPDAVCSAQTSISINADIERVWSTILNFPLYHEWNTYVPEIVVVDALGFPTADQTAAVGAHLRFKVTMPMTKTNELLTDLNHANYSVAWIYNEPLVPSLLLSAKRWQVLSTFNDNGQTKVFYETREEYLGPLAYVVNSTVLPQVQQGFEDVAAGLKQYTEE